METKATLIHSDSNLVTRAQLAALPPVVGTDTFKPVAHIELVLTLEKALLQREIRIQREQFAISKGGNKFFGTLDLTLNGIKGTCASLGLRQAINRTMSIQIIAGMRIFVCDNLAFNGDMVCLKRRHTSGLDLIKELNGAVLEYEQHYQVLKLEIENLKNRQLTDTDAKAIIYDIFTNSKAKHALPSRYLRDVGNEYFNPRHEDFKPRTAWSLHNAFTEVAKVLPLASRMTAVQEIGASKHFGLVGVKN